MARSVVPSSELRMLVADYRKQAMRMESSADRDEFGDLSKRMLRLRARELAGVINDLEDLIAGKENPAKRRGEGMRERSNG